MNLKKWWGSLPTDFTLSKVIFMFLKLLTCVSKFKTSSILESVIGHLDLPAYLFLNRAKGLVTVQAELFSQILSTISSTVIYDKDLN